MPDIVLDYSLTFRAPVSIFTGLGIAGLVDRTIVRDACNRPYIPGSTVKGRLRYFAECALRSPGRPPNLAVHAAGRVCKDAATQCTICRLFGTAAFRGLLRVSDAHPAPTWERHMRELRAADPNPVVRPDVEIRPGIAVSRSLRTAFSEHLFFDESVPAAQFSGRILLGVGVTPGEIRFLVGVGRLVDAFGARKAAGRGALDGGIRIQCVQT